MFQERLREQAVEPAAEPARPAGLDGEVAALALVAAAAAILAARSGEARQLLPGAALPLICLAWRLEAPGSWRRWRSGALAAVRLSLAAPSALPFVRLSPGAARSPFAPIDGPLGWLHFTFILTVASGTAGLALVGAGPPVRACWYCR